MLSPQRLDAAAKRHGAEGFTVIWWGRESDTTMRVWDGGRWRLTEHTDPARDSTKAMLWLHSQGTLLSKIVVLKNDSSQELHSIEYVNDLPTIAKTVLVPPML